MGINNEISHMVHRRLNISYNSKSYTDLDYIYIFIFIYNKL